MKESSIKINIYNFSFGYCILTVGLKALDLITTLIAIQSPGVTEHNPMVLNLPVVSAVLLIIFSIIFIIAGYVCNKYKLKFLAIEIIIGLTILNIWQLFLILNNILNIIYF